MTMFPLRVIADPRQMRIHSEDLRRDGRRIAFVPTMGYLHAGHVSLLEEGRRRSDILVLSIFVNPTQFGPNEDLARYPRDLEGDLDKARGAGVDFAFVPEPAGMYPDGSAAQETWVTVERLSQGLCGDKRPGHFRGVATVVAKLFNIVKPHLALFGEKDYQQLAVIRRMARDLDFDVEIVGMPIVREADGLAMSSRNAYLSTDEKRDERKQALVLSRALARAEELVRAGERDPRRLEAEAREIVSGAPDARVDYIDVRDAASLAAIDRLERPAVMALAVFIGKTRLIDNRVLDPGRS